MIGKNANYEGTLIKVYNKYVQDYKEKIKLYKLDIIDKEDYFEDFSEDYPDCSLTGLINEFN